MPEVSVIIPTFNYARYLDRSIQSVLNQTYKDYEIIVVDDGSMDNTKEVVKKYENRIQYIYQKNKGQSSARNVGILNSKGRYVLLLDSDDLLLPEALKTQIDFLHSNPYNDIVYCSCDCIDEEDKNILCRTKKTKKERDLFEDLLLGKIYLVIHALLIPRRCFEKIGLFDENLSGDAELDIFLRFCNAGYKFSHIDNVLVSYRLHVGSRGDTNINDKLKNKIAILEKTFKDHVSEPKTETLKKKAYYHAFSECSWYYYQNRRQSESMECLLKAISIFPEALMDPKIFKQWIRSSIPWRDRIEGIVDNKVSDIEEFLRSFLKKIFNNNSLPISIKLAKNKIYSNFYVTLSEQYYTDKINKARMYFFKAVKFNPYILISHENIRLFIKIILGKNIMAGIKYHRKAKGLMKIKE